MRRILFIICLCILFICYYDETETVRKSKIENIALITDTVSYYKNKLNTQTAYVKTLVVEKNKFRDILLKKDKDLAVLTHKFNRIDHITKYKNITIVDTIRVKFKDSIPCVFKLKGQEQKNWYSFKYTFTQKGIEIDSFSIPTQTTVIKGLKKKWLLGPKILTTEITNSNPYIKVTEIKSADILTESWYKKWYVWFIAGLTCGVFAISN